MVKYKSNLEMEPTKIFRFVLQLHQTIQFQSTQKLRIYVEIQFFCLQLTPQKIAMFSILCHLAERLIGMVLKRVIHFHLILRFNLF